MLTEGLNNGQTLVVCLTYDYVQFKITSKMAVFAIALMMEAARSSETLVNFYQTTRRYNPEDSHLRTNRRENLKSYKIYIIL
jgi:hypothetical protein